MEKILYTKPYLFSLASPQCSQCIPVNHVLHVKLLKVQILMKICARDAEQIAQKSVVNLKDVTPVLSYDNPVASCVLCGCVEE